jgi:hypothetical protein
MSLLTVQGCHSNPHLLEDLTSLVMVSIEAPTKLWIR